MIYTYKSVYLDNSEIEVCKALAQMRANANNSKYIQSDFIGLLGELAYGKFFNLYVDVSIGKRINTYDFIHNEKRVDVKTNERIDGALIIKQKDNPDVDMYALAVLDETTQNVIHLVGYIEKEILRNENNLRCFTYNDGSKNYKYIMHQKELKRF